MKTVGVDIVENERIAASIARFGDRFLQRVYTEQELLYCNGRIGSLAARWAAKEAVAKAFGTGIGAVGFRDIEVVNGDKLAPKVVLHGPAIDVAARQGITSMALSISHTREHAVAFVVAA
jgi:holo-[acyl-carrier protein] synthase